jgi:predicted aldo/keto reductase-like oxidoreductase
MATDWSFIAISREYGGLPMQYRVMKSTGDKLSALGFGCMRLPRKGVGTDEERSIKQLRYAIDNGVNYLDTALLYPGSEVVVGKALAGGYREKVRLATKLPYSQVKKREDMDKLLDVQLQKLRTDHIDYYLLHNLNFAAWEKMKGLGMVDFIRTAKGDGRIKHIGFSCHAGTPEFKKLIDDYGWEFCQIQYNILDENNQAGKEGLKYAASKGLGVIIMEPLRGGNLTKTVPPAIKKIWDEATTKRTPAEWAFRWIWNHPEVTVVLSGMNDEVHIRENLMIAGEACPNSLTKTELQLVRNVEMKYRELMKVACTGCRYCMPCSSGVNIPLCFEEYNNLYLADNPDGEKFMYAARLGGAVGLGEPEFASLCVQCGQCVEKCPQHIDIPVVLESVVEELEGPDLEQRVAMAKQAFKQT